MVSSPTQPDTTSQWQQVQPAARPLHLFTAAWALRTPESVFSAVSWASLSDNGAWPDCACVLCNVGFTSSPNETGRCTSAPDITRHWDTQALTHLGGSSQALPNRRGRNVRSTAPCPRDCIDRLCAEKCPSADTLSLHHPSHSQVAHDVLLFLCLLPLCCSLSLSVPLSFTGCLCQSVCPVSFCLSLPISMPSPSLSLPPYLR